VNGGLLANDQDIDSSALTVSVLDGPDHGTLTLNPDGSFTYAADADVFDLLASGQNVDVSFTYTVTDGELSDTATASIEVTGNGGDNLIVNGTNKPDTIARTGEADETISAGNGTGRAAKITSKSFVSRCQMAL
jgi:VCBS repeat-containing protein